MRDHHERLKHILEAIERIEKYAAEGPERFRADDLVQNWMLRHLQIIGEAARALPAEFREAHPNVPWSEIIGMRHILVHDYFEIDLGIVWRVVEKDLPVLKRQIRRILREARDGVQE